VPIFWGKPKLLNATLGFINPHWLYNYGGVAGYLRLLLKWCPASKTSGVDTKQPALNMLLKIDKNFLISFWLKIKKKHESPMSFKLSPICTNSLWFSAKDLNVAIPTSRWSWNPGEYLGAEAWDLQIRPEISLINGYINCYFNVVIWKYQKVMDIYIYIIYIICGYIINIKHFGIWIGIWNTISGWWYTYCTPLKNIKVSWNSYSQYMEKVKHVPNHQADMVIFMWL